MNKDKNPQSEQQKTRQIQTLLTRGVQEVLPSHDFLKSQLSSGKKLKIYAGVDPTGPTLHIGHAIVFRKLRQFQDLGHGVIMLVGDFTAMIGDPDKMSIRKPLTEKEVKQNLKLYTRQASKILRFTGPNKVKVVYNSAWLKKLTMRDVIGISSLMTVDQMLKRDMFVKRMEQKNPISIHEFMYPLMQGYDSVALGVDVEIGGNDQMFNMMTGRDLLKKMKNHEKTCITMKLLTDSEGKKMGKTEGNMVSFLDTHFEMFGKIMSWTDGMIANGFELCTDVEESELSNIRQQLKDGSVNPRDLKIRLAEEIIGGYYGQKEAKEASENFIKTFSNKEIPEDIKETKAAKGELLSAILLKEGIVSSVGDFKRLVKEKAVHIQDGDTVSDFNYAVTDHVTLKVGKKRFISIKVD